MERVNRQPTPSPFKTHSRCIGGQNGCQEIGAVSEANFFNDRPRGDVVHQMKPSTLARATRLFCAALIALGQSTSAAAPRARAVQFEEKVIYHPPENPGFAA